MIMQTSPYSPEVGPPVMTAVQSPTLAAINVQITTEHQVRLFIKHNVKYAVMNIGIEYGLEY